jgi:hypothetical protein
MKRGTAWLVGLFVLGATACRSERELRADAESAVRNYLARVVEAYRTSNASLVDPLVSEQQGLKLTALIGVKQDSGLVLDAKLLDLQFTKVAREGQRWVVETRERWYYQDRRMRTGAREGEDSTDSYAMRYRFSRDGDRWILEDLEFAEPPQVGRKTAPASTDARVLHGFTGEAAPLPPSVAAPVGAAPGDAKRAPPASAPQSSPAAR